MARLLALLVLLGGCTAADSCPESLYWNPLTCRCHSGATGGFVGNSCCLKEGVSLDACPVTEPSDG